uniref:Saposin B-type domain-containing protein n=1 Tax=Rhabditophanes sp. KR3021 TaxID=114890 RepID=A0AC35TXF5_9BILA
MSKLIIALAICVLAVSITHAASTECTICHEVIGAAEQHFKNGEPETTLLTDLTRLCYTYGGEYGINAITACLQIVDAHIDKIYGHFQNGMTPCQICTLAKSCVASDACSDSF